MKNLYKPLFPARTGRVAVTSDRASGIGQTPSVTRGSSGRPQDRAFWVQALRKPPLALAVACSLGGSGAAWATATGGTPITGFSATNVCQQDGSNDMACGTASTAGTVINNYSTATGAYSMVSGSGSTASGYNASDLLFQPIRRTTKRPPLCARLDDVSYLLVDLSLSEPLEHGQRQPS